MKRFFIITFAIFLAITVTACGETSSSNEGIGSKGVSKEEFDNLTFDMYFWDVQEIIGTEDFGETVSSEEVIGKYDMKSRVEKIKFYGEKSGYAIFTFTDFELTKKEQFDLS